MSDPSAKHIGRYDLITPMLPCKDEILAGFERFLMSGQYILGEEVRKLEEELAADCQVSAAVGVASGSSALFLALSVAGVRPGDEVITTPYTFDATMEAIILLDAVPVFVDIKPQDLNIDPERIAAAVTPKTRAILPVPIFGAPCDMNPILDVAAEHDLEVITDMAQAWGTFYDGRPIGSCSRMSTLSFYPTKNLPGIGDGGMIFCRDEQDAELIRRIRGHQPVRMNGHLYTGWNSRLDEIQAMVIRIRRARFADEQRDRDQVAAIYDSYIPTGNRLQTPNGGAGMKVTYHQYWVRSRNRRALRELLADEGIDTGVYYAPPLNHHELAEYCRCNDSLTEAERAGREILTLPIHAALPFADAHRIGAMVGEFLAQEAASTPA